MANGQATTTAVPVRPPLPPAKNRKRKRDENLNSSAARCLDFPEEEKNNTTKPVPESTGSLAQLQERFELVERDYRQLCMELEQHPEVRHAKNTTADARRRACVRLFRRWARYCFQQLLLPSDGLKRVVERMRQGTDLEPVRVHGLFNAHHKCLPKLLEAFETCLEAVWNVQGFVDLDPAGGGRHARHELVLISDRQGHHLTVSEHRYGALNLRHPKQREQRAPPRVQIVAQVLLESGVSLAWIASEIRAVTNTGVSRSAALIPGNQLDTPMIIDDEATSDSDGSDRLPDLVKQVLKENQALSQRVDAMTDLLAKLYDQNRQ